MTFPPIPDNVPTDIPEFRLILWHTEVNGQTTEGIDYSFTVLWSNGDRRAFQGDVIPYCTPEEVAWLAEWGHRMLAKAELEMLGTTP